MSKWSDIKIYDLSIPIGISTLINELIDIFIPPDHATSEELETAKRNMEKYADYRTYLSFDMQQLIQNEDEVLKIRLSKMIRKNSGGEGQNPLYVALDSSPEISASAAENTGTTAFLAASFALMFG